MPATTTERRELERRFDADEEVIFVSDVHLRFQDEPYLRQFLTFLEAIPKRTRALVIHGDLFEFYVGRRQGKHDFYRPLFAALRALRDRGVAVAALYGNRDYLLDRSFAESGALVVPDRLIMNLGGAVTHVSHGDEFCLDDHSYQFWARGVLRWRIFRGVVQGLPLATGILAARSYRRISARKARRRATHQNRGSRLSTVFPGCRKLIDETPYPVVICGHIHDLGARELNSDRARTWLVTTGAWEDVPNCIRWTEGELQTSTFDPATATFRREYSLPRLVTNSPAV